MPKIRGVKPEFWTSDGIVEMSIPARLLFIGLWNYACDNGHLRDKTRQIKTRLLPGDDVKVGELLDEMVEAGQIERVDGWIVIPDLTHHQKPHKRWWSSCDKPGCEPPEGASHAPTHRGATVAQPEHNGGTRGDNRVATADGDGDGDGDGELTRKPARKRASQLPSDFTPSKAVQETATSLGVDLRREWPKFCDHHRAKGSTFKDWDAALRNWVRKAAEYGGNVTPLTRTDDQGRQILPPLPPSSPFGGGS